MGNQGDEWLPVPLSKGADSGAAERLRGGHQDVGVWRLSSAATVKQLTRAFSNRQIDFTSPGFYDHPAFAAAESVDRNFLVTYARYVEARNYDEAYLQGARRKIELVAQVMCDLVGRDGRLGACADVSGMISRMLDCLGVWNYCAKATLTLATPSGHIDPRYYWVLSEGDFDAAHAFVVAPPFYVVDVTLRYQPNLGPYEQLLPTRVVWDTMKGASWSEIDLKQPQLSREIAAFTSFSRYLDEQYPDMVRVMEQLPARSVNTDLVNLKYIPVAVGATRGPLEQLMAYCPCGRTPYEIFTSEILPRA